MEQRLALPERVLMQIEKPARYIGNEVNMVRKNLSEVDVRIAMCFPDVYEIGMSYLGIQILYDMFNRREDVYCERVYSPVAGFGCNHAEGTDSAFFFGDTDEYFGV